MNKTDHKQYFPSTIRAEENLHSRQMPSSVYSWFTYKDKDTVMIMTKVKSIHTQRSHELVSSLKRGRFLWKPSGTLPSWSRYETH